MSKYTYIYDKQIINYMSQYMIFEEMLHRNHMTGDVFNGLKFCTRI